MHVVVVESPAKAKTINRYLGSDFRVVASYGHVRDLPPKDGSVRPDEDFAMSWALTPKSDARVDAIAKAIEGADTLYLATDPDREGEAISWHVLELLNESGALEGVTVQRVVFNEITKSAVLAAIANPRDLDRPLIDAYLARRALDYLVGFTLSPVLWRKLPGSRSAGRVQSVALRLVCEREAEIEIFRAQEYWTVDAELTTAAGSGFTARLSQLDGSKLGKFDLPDESAATAAVAKVGGGEQTAAPFTVTSVERKEARRNPPPPFITSTLQQEASRKLGFAARHAMQIAQRLYEGIDLGGETVGLITYMRTDSVNVAAEALAQARDHISSAYGAAYLPDKPRTYKSSARNAQEAHEAVRPTDMSRTPDAVRSVLDRDQFRLYELIWKRAVASQMASARLDQVAVEADNGGAAVLRATGSQIAFDGFLKLYQEGRDDVENGNGAGADDEDRMLPPVKEGERLTLGQVTPEQHFTQPPPRYTEASLVKRLEELGIGRPSTYASIMSVLQDRDYVRLESRRFIPEDRGRVVTAFLSNFFHNYVQYDFTAELETQLDDISAGRADWKGVLTNFWTNFARAVEGTKGLTITNVIDALDEDLGPHFFPPREEDGGNPRACPGCEDGRLGLKLGKFGAFIARRRRRRGRGRCGAGGRTAGAGHRSRIRRGGNHPQGALRDVYSARRARGQEKAQARLYAQGHRPDDADTGERASALGAAPRDRHPSGNRKTDHGRHRPLRPLCGKRQKIRLASRR
jgi:DNA topoisomerase-1